MSPLDRHLIVLSLLVAVSHLGAEAQTLPGGWLAHSTPTENSSEIACANYSNLEWLVSTSQTGTVEITARPKPYGAKSSTLELPSGVKRDKDMLGVESKVKTSNGWLLGFDAGEFGGGLWFANDSGRTRKLSNENVRGFVETSAGFLVFVGLAHMEMDSGKVLIVTEHDSDVGMQTLAKLDGAPQAVTRVSADVALVVTTHGISQVSSAGEIKTLLHRTFGLLYPNSVVSLPDGTVYTGMRLFVVRLVKQSGGYAEQWLVPENCKRFRVQGLDCRCSK
jgi:hypothetical protein